jgi:hypothetical protein
MCVVIPRHVGVLNGCIFWLFEAKKAGPRVNVDKRMSYNKITNKLRLGCYSINTDMSILFEITQYKFIILFKSY